MSFKSKSEMRRWGEMVKTGEIPKHQYDAKLKQTENVHLLPERIEPQHPKIPRIKQVGTTRVIK